MWWRIKCKVSSESDKEYVENKNVLFSQTVPLTLHWDKVIFLIFSSKKSVNRLTLLVLGKMELQFWEYLVYLVVQDKVQAEAVYDILENWNLINRMQFMSFNPTASNTGITAGCCIILE